MLFTGKDKALVKLIDFGFAKMDNTVLQTPIGTAAYVGS
jgi:serine/threonine protein kinase